MRHLILHPLRTFAAVLLLAPGLSWACACGCGVFDVGTASMFPSGSGGVASLEYDYMNQDRNWSGSSSAPAANNDDKQIRTSFFTAGLQYMFNRTWGVMAQVPYWHRYFNTTQDDGSIAGFTHAALGDVRLRGVYTGFSPDMSSGVTFGVKLPTGDYTYPNFDRDTEIGTGSTDLLLGGYHLGALTADGAWDHFEQVSYDRPVMTRGGYRPGNELDAAVGVYHNGGGFGVIDKVAPVLQLIVSDRLRDTGPLGDPANTGYQRVLLSPGVEFDTGNVRLYTDVEFPIYQQVNGNQLVAPVLFKLILARSF